PDGTALYSRKARVTFAVVIPSEVEESLAVGCRSLLKNFRDVSTEFTLSEVEGLDMTKLAATSEKKDPLVEEFLRYLSNERNASPRTLKAYRQALAGFRAENKTS